jgi:integrating conjugative element protein (TIGR03765 family)
VTAVCVQADALPVRNKPLVVHEGQSTLSALSYYQRLTWEAASNSTIAAPAGASRLSLEARLPLIPGRLSVGQPTLHTLEGQITPLFIMGLDAVSLAWFDQAAPGLADIGARGVVVQADRLVAWRRLQQQAADRGIDLMLLDGDALADGYGISTYPIVIVSPQQAGSP